VSNGYIIMLFGFFLGCAIAGYVLIRKANQISSSVSRALVVALLRSLFYAPTVIVSTDIAPVPTLFAVGLWLASGHPQWQFLWPAGGVFVLSLVVSAVRDRVPHRSADATQLVAPAAVSASASLRQKRG
jgi:hypothetical protein